jgi:uncharacterized protein (DUF4415 family)/uncharacterized DUF497 family protein
MSLRFTWYDAKAVRNWRKHHVSFETAARAFTDPFALSEQDRIEGGELRWQTIGEIEGALVVLVAHTVGGDAVAPRLFTSSPLAERRGPKGGAMSRKSTVSYALDPERPAPLTPAQSAELADLAALPDARIDTSDIPPLAEAFWKNAVRNPFYRPVKQQVTVRLDADVLAWLRSTGRGYQGRLNDILRQAMLRRAVKD